MRDASPSVLIQLDGVGKRYPDGTVAVGRLDLQIVTGEVAVLVGPSGCGKTTTLQMMNRLVDPTSGRILLDGQDIAATDPVQLRRRIGYVIQQVGLFPHQTVAANVATVPRLLGWSKPRRAARVDELLVLVGLEPRVYRHRYPHQLSGGQRQRVGVARALAADPPVLLMDEPFGAVDPVARARLQEEFRALQQALAKTVVFVTHDVDEAVRLGDRIAVLSEGGRLEQFAPPAVVLGSPATPFVAEFVGSDRAVRRLAVTRIDPAVLEQGPPPPGWPAVGAGETLHAALAAMLASDAGGVAVVADGRCLGLLTPASLHAALRRSIAAGTSEGGGSPRAAGTAQEAG